MIAILLRCWKLVLLGIHWCVEHWFIFGSVAAVVLLWYSGQYIWHKKDYVITWTRVNFRKVQARVYKTVRYPFLVKWLAY